MGANDAKAAAEHKFQIYDADKGTFLGRTGASWLKITVFYIAYFAFLAGLFTASIQLMQSQLPQEDGKFKKPKLNTRLNIPGLNYFPKFGADNADQKQRLGDNNGIAFYWQDGKKDGSDGYQYYVKQTEEVFKSYAATPSCAGCKDFNTQTLGACADPQASWDAGKPCVYFRLNRVIDWQPVGLFKPEDGTFFAKDGPTKPMVKDATYIRCEAKDEDGNVIDSPFTYFGGDNNGGDGYFPADYFPYKGKVDQETYESPIVAVQISDSLEDDEEYRITCQAFAGNIIRNKERKIGSETKFHLKKNAN